MPDYNDGAALTRRFMEKWETGDPEMQKKGVYAINSYVRWKLRENGIVRSPLLPPLDIADGQLDKDDDPKILKKYMEIEPDSEATSVPFRGQPVRKFVKGKFVAVYFYKIESTEHIVNIIELKNYSNDLRKILNEHDVKEIQEIEDTTFLTEIDRIAAANPAEQDIDLYGGLTKNNWVSATQAFYINRPIKYALMNTRTYKEFLKWDYVRDMGFGQYGADAFSKGTLPTINGIQIIQSIKANLIPDGVVYYFAPEDFIGKFFTLMPPTTSIEQKKDWLTFSTYEWVGIGIANVRCFVKATFNP